MICIHTGPKKQRVLFRSGVGPVRMPVRWCPAGRGAVAVRYGCRRFIYACTTLNRNAKNVHAGIDWESFPKHRVESKKICVMPACWLSFLKKVLPRDERVGAPWSCGPERDMQPARDGKDRDQGPGGRVSWQRRMPQKRSPSGGSMPGQGRRGGQEADRAGRSR